LPTHFQIHLKQPPSPPVPFSLHCIRRFGARSNGAPTRSGAGVRPSSARRRRVARDSATMRAGNDGGARAPLGFHEAWAPAQHAPGRELQCFDGRAERQQWGQQRQLGRSGPGLAGGA
ncbi:unnamed protein product, partial [Urochloa humidicola]